jgi:chromosome partitioning protein
MTIYVIANQKGGVGKTTLSTNLAVALSKKGQTILVDGDDQQSSIKWSKRRTQDSITTISLKDNLKEELQQLKKIINILYWMLQDVIQLSFVQHY